MNGKTPQVLKTYKEGAGASRPRPFCVCLQTVVVYHSSCVFPFNQSFGRIYFLHLSNSRSTFGIGYWPPHLTLPPRGLGAAAVGTFSK